MRIDTFFLLAEWSNLGDHFTGRNAEFTLGDWFTLVAIVAGVAGTIWGMVEFQRRQQGRLTSNRPCHLFDELCAAHRLKFRDRRLLKSLAQELQLKTPAELFVRPDCFDNDQLPAALRRYEIQVERIGERLFEGLAVPTPQPTSPAAVPVACPSPLPSPLPLEQGGIATDGASQLQ